MTEASRPTVVFMSGAVEPGNLARCVRRATRSGGPVHVISELRETLPDAEAISQASTLDDFRRSDLTIRSSALRADALLRDLRPLVGERFSYLGRSLWLANETNLLHFHFLRVVDALAVVRRIFDELRPRRVVCVGTMGGSVDLAKVVIQVARSRGVPHSVVGGPRSRARAGLWRL